MSSPATALLRKDLRITRVLWVPTAFSYCVFLLLFLEHAWVYLATGSFLAFGAASIPLVIDDHYQTEPLFAALPGTRRSLVAGRYLAFGMATAACLALFLAFTALIRAGFGERAASLASLLSVRGTAGFLAGATLAGLCFLPLHFCFGFWRGLRWFCVAGIVLSIAALHAASYLVPAAALGSGSAAPLPAVIASTARGLRALAWLIETCSNRPWALATCAAVLALLVYLSFRLSVRLYRNRDL